uniref:Uncharacterized protein n=1 Tax=Arundo donax TaxID=35708 RepID=A0A0A9GUL9_ARUDO
MDSFHSPMYTAPILNLFLLPLVVLLFCTVMHQFGHQVAERNKSQLHMLLCTMKNTLANCEHIWTHKLKVPMSSQTHSTSTVQ